MYRSFHADFVITTRNRLCGARTILLNATVSDNDDNDNNNNKRKKKVLQLYLIYRMMQTFLENSFREKKEINSVSLVKKNIVLQYFNSYYYSHKKIKQC